MSEKILTVDLHCHPNLKSFNSGFPKPVVNMWEKIHHKIEGKLAQTVNELSIHVLKESQSNLEALAEGNVRVFQVSLYPTERGFLHMRNVPKMLIGKKRINVMQEVITGYDSSCIVESKKHYNYYEELLAEYAYVRDQQGKSPDGKREFVLVNNYTELETALKKKNALIGIITIEGAHVFGTGSPEADKMTKPFMKLMVAERIAAIKAWEYPPFMVNLAHHFWNHLSGHATSFKPPINSLVNQNKGKNRGITEVGWYAIREMLSRENGKRILIDTKHMSLEARKEYYAFIGNYNFLNPGDKIPIVASHAFMNGFATMDASVKENDIAAKARKHRFYRWSINISNEEAKLIHESGGLIGLMMDKGNMGGIELVKKITLIEDEKKKREEFVRLFWDNAFQIVKAVGEKGGWDTVAIGSDFDGTITHLDPYESAAKYPLLQQDMIEYLEETDYQKELWYGYSPRVLVQKIFGENAMRFYKQYFV
jgi:microsomal dipeptidase-like Zn-dependent dipeptidase